MLSEKTHNPNEQSWKLLVLLLKKIARAKGITDQVISLRTGLQATNVNRLFSLRYCPSLQNFLIITKAVEVNFFIEDQNSKTDLNILMEQAMTELGQKPDKLPKN